MKIVVLDGHTVNPGDNPWDEIAKLGELTVFDRTPEELVVERGREAEILLTNKTRLAAETLAALSALRFVSVLATGYDVVDVAAARRRGVAVSNVPEYGTDSVAQHVFALLLELCNQTGLHAAAVAGGEWTRCKDFCFWKAPLVELAGLTMGIVGFGRIGRKVTTLARALGMRVIAGGGSHRSPDVEWREIPALFSQADVVSLHCPLTAENARFVDRRLLARMKRTAFFLNTARGGLVDEAALRDALHAAELAGAAVDVVSKEPIDAENPLLEAPNCIITPHIAWASLAARRRLVEITAKNIEGFLSGRPGNLVS